MKLEEVITEVTSEFLKRHDPIEKAKRHRVKTDPSPPEPAAQLVTLQVAPKRVPIPRKIFHQVAWRDQRRCTHLLPDGSRCQQSRWVEVHHKTPVSLGGLNTVDNLTTLCSAHHRLFHQSRAIPSPGDWSGENGG